MSLIKIAERQGGPNELHVALSIDDGGEFVVGLALPFTPEEEQELEWYFEQRLREPFTGQVRAASAAQSVRRYGERLFSQLFADNEAHAQYRAVCQAGLGTLRFEIVGSPDFHALHWEALHDPKLPRAFALEAPFVRKDTRSKPLRTSLRPAPTLNILLVCARAGHDKDVAYRTISRPLIEALGSSALRVQIDLVRPGTYKALTRQLEASRQQHGDGYYHIVHFDLHGALLSHGQFAQEVEADRFTYQARYGRADLPSYAGRKAFLFFESEQGERLDPAEASEVAQLLMGHQIPIAILNACQSGKHAGANEASLAAHLMQAGMQLVLAMGYSVTVSAAALLMQRLYSELFAGREPAQATALARRTLHDQKERRANFNQRIDLEDWVLPVLYESQPTRLLTREFTPEESSAYYGRRAQRYRPAPLSYGFLGRDLDILRIERRLLGEGGRNMLLVQGMGGAGKSTLLRHLAEWWQRTGLVEQVFSFAYDEQAWNRQQIIDAIGRQLLGEIDYLRLLQPLPIAAQQELIAERLRASRHLIILDNLESITGAEMAIAHTLPPAEQANLRSLLAALAGGRTLVLLGSRAAEGWLAAGTFEHSRYELGGLDPEAATALAEQVLDRHSARRHQSDPATRELLSLLGGFPLAIEVVLANLANQTPSAVLAALKAGDAAIDPLADSQDKTRSILRCIDYSHSNLDPAAQELLLCLAPFVGVINADWLPQYAEQLRKQPALAQLPVDQLPAVVAAAQKWGLLAPHQIGGGYLHIQPTLPFFLRTRLGERGELRAVIESAFREHYRDIGQALYKLATAKEPQQQQLGLALIGLEEQSLALALDMALAAQEQIDALYLPLDALWKRRQNTAKAAERGRRIAALLEGYPADALSGGVGVELMRVLGDLAARLMTLQQPAEAGVIYQRCLGHIDTLTTYSARDRAIWQATAYHQLGRVAQEQRQWAQAAQHYQQALAIFVEFDDRHSQATVYHQLGIVAQEQRQWGQARAYLLTALSICREFSDEYHSAMVLHNLARLQRASGEPIAAAELAAAMQLSEGEALARWRRALQAVAGDVEDEG